MKRAMLFGVLLVACGAKDEAKPAVAPAATPEAAPSSAPAAVAPSSGKQKRTRTRASAPPERDGTKPKNGRALNPRDPVGRMVFVRADDHCFVEVAGKGAREGEVTRATEDVDCPPGANDPAFDHCTAQIVLEEGTTKCYCVNGSAHPRPMPNPTPCPTSK